MRDALKIWGWLVMAFAAVSLALYLQAHLGQLAELDDPSARKKIRGQIAGNTSLCLLSLGVGFLCRPISRRHKTAMVGGFLCGATTVVGLVAASNVRNVVGPYRIPELASQSDLMFVLAFFAIPCALVAAIGFTVLVDYRSDR